MSFENPEKGLYYFSFNPNVISKADASIELSKAYPQAIGSHFTQKEIAPIEHKDPSSLPVTAMFLSAEDKLDIILGNICVVVVLNFKQIEQFCNEKGIPLQILINQHEDASFILRQKRERIVTPSLWHRIFMEGLSLETFAQLLLRAPKNSNGNVEGWISNKKIEKYDPLPLVEKIGFIHPYIGSN